MEETHKFLEQPPIDHDATLATPRFDEVEAQVARPVVPLAENPVRRAEGNGRRRQWPIALVLISALAGGVVSILAFHFYQKQQQSTVAAQTVSETAESPAAQEAPSPAAEQNAAAPATEEQAQTDVPMVFEEFDPATEGSANTTSDAAPARKTVNDAKPAGTATRADEDREETKPAPRAVEARPRRAESPPASRQVEARHDDRRGDDRAVEDDDSRFDEQRERRRQRREQRRERRRNIDRIKDIFEGPPPA